MTVFVDTNLWVRLLAGDDREQAESSEKLIRTSLDRGDTLLVTVLVCAEIAWVLVARYKISRTRVLEYFEALANTPGVEIEEVDRVLSAAMMSATLNVDFADAYNAALCRERQVTTAFTFDRQHFDRLPFTEVRTPG